MENVIKYLKTKWEQLTAFNKKEDVKEKLWEEIVEYYSRRKRFYHNLTHIGNLFHLFDEYAGEVENKGLVGFAIFYHDIEYDTLRADNEEQSAQKATDHLQRLSLKPSFIENIVAMILATKKHEADPAFPFKKDMELFLDWDLAVLADEWSDYELYSDNIRKEYGQYNDNVYRSGRKNALQQVLKKKTIYYSPNFYSLWEEKARQNLNREISLL